ncbi:MAG TPA: orotidine-5'-phosphate decarboxylase [Candidatus Saccharimonadales bacterium]|nr:orotidine-5'-phosphate decarboxylase [Candidatus Saccharimonadales bacterium]
MEFLNKLRRLTERNNTLLCVGLDSGPDKIPAHITGRDRVFEFNKAIIDATHELVCAYKPNSAFYEASGAAGLKQLKLTCDYLKSTYPDISIILDAKRADIGSTNTGYVKFAFDYLGADAITVQPYLGREALAPFLDRKDKGIIVLCRTSNPGSGEFQDLKTDGKKLYQAIAENVRDQWNQNGNCLLVAGATYPRELSDLRKIMGDDFVFLVPGIGAQGGDVEATIKAGMNKSGGDLIVNSSRGIIFASEGKNFAQSAASQAKTTRQAINNARRE